MLVLAVAVAPGCAGRPLTTSAPAGDADSRAAQLTARGDWDQARQLVERSLADARARGDRAEQARLLLRRAKVTTDDARHRGPTAGAPSIQEDLAAARSLAEAAGDAAVIAASLDALGMAQYTHWYDSQTPDDLAGAERLFRQALALHEPRGDSGALAQSYFHVGLIFQMRGDQASAHREFDHALAVAERVHDDLQISYATRHLGYLAKLANDWPTAEANLIRSLELSARMGPGPGVAAAQIALAEMRYEHDGASAPALTLLGRARDLAARTHSIAYTAIADAGLGRVYGDLAAYDRARALFAGAIAAMDGIHSDEDVPENYERLALIDLLADLRAAAVADLERALAHHASSRLEALQVLARARASGHPAAARDDNDAVVAARLLLAAGSPDAALEVAIRGNDPDTLLLAARAVGPAGFARATRAAAAMSRAQELRFERERVRLAGQ
jgi:tetratricopeptide (TPR) repeat protein